VLAQGNKPGGYSGDGGLETKFALLKLEGAASPAGNDQKDQYTLAFHS
jgi:methylated-DNA-[protein]-cysteine S-methyltransferase